MCDNSDYRDATDSKSLIELYIIGTSLLLIGTAMYAYVVVLVVSGPDHNSGINKYINCNINYSQKIITS